MLRKALDQIYDLVEVKESGDKGLGVFCTRDIQAGEVGISSRPILEETNRTAYSIQVDWNKHIVTDKPAYFVNHSCNPTVGVKFNQYGAYDLVARKNLPAGSEITFCYSTTEYEIMGFRECFCGSSQCLKIITGWKDYPESRKRIFIEEGFVAPYLLNEKSKPLT